MDTNKLQITYKGQTIVDASIDNELTKTIKTSGKYCEGDIIVSAKGGSGGGFVEERDWGVNFYDFDGSLLASWAPEEAMAATALPPNPDHSSDITWGGKTIPLTAMGWNWTLAEIQHYISTYAEQEPRIDVGQQYDTNGKIYLEIDNTRSVKGLSLRFTFTGTCTIDWGDGTTSTATSNAHNDHTYTDYGRYLITITPSSGAITLTMASNSPYLLRDTEHGTTFSNAKILKGIYLSAGCGYTNYCLSQYGCIGRIVLAYSATQLYNNMSRTTEFTATVIIPRTTTKANSNGNILGGSKVIIHPLFVRDAIDTASNATQFFTDGNNYFYPEATKNPGYAGQKTRRMLLCEGNEHTPQINVAQSYMEYLILPSTITTICKMPFTALEYLKFKSITPPTCADSTYMGSLPTYCRILVPRGTLNAYKTATNYPNPTTYTYEEYD